MRTRFGDRKTVVSCPQRKISTADIGTNEFTRVSWRNDFSHTDGRQLSHSIQTYEFIATTVRVQKYMRLVYERWRAYHQLYAQNGLNLIYFVPLVSITESYRSSRDNSKSISQWQLAVRLHNRRVQYYTKRVFGSVVPVTECHVSSYINHAVARASSSETT